MPLSPTLETLRRSKGLSRTQAAYHLGVSTVALTRWETGARLPSWEHAVRLADLYGVSMDELRRAIENGTAANRAMTNPESYLVGSTY